MSSMLELPPVVAEPQPRTIPVQAPPHLRVVPDLRLDFDEAVRRITPRLQRYARRRLGDAHEAEELVQEALLRAYKHGDQLLTEDDLIAWCTVVTGRLVIDRLRVRGRSVNVAEVPEGARVGRDTAEVVVARDEARMALDALDAMPARQAAVLWAREVEGQAYDEIGQRFGMTEPAVRSILTRARKALRKEYAVRGGTLPVGGLAVLAPWVSGLRWADRLRSAATRVVAPAAVGALALGLVGGALHSPLFDHTTATPTRTQAVVSTRLAGAAAVRPGALPVRRPVTAPVRPTSISAAPTTARVPTLTEDGPLKVACVGSARTGAAAGNETCGEQKTSANVYLTPVLPNNPTGVREVGVETDYAQCSDIPDTPLTTCRTDPSNGGPR
jgi:RNA polymerase sigma-70 factor (ECF subfamily)